MLRFKCLSCGVVKRVQNSEKVILLYRLRKNPLFPQKIGYLGYCERCR
jgi:hypothetical protein